ERDILPRTRSAVEGPVRLATLALLLGGICLLASWRPGRSTGSESRLPMNVQPNPDRGRPPAAAGGSAGGGHLGEGPRGLIAGESTVDSEQHGWYASSASRTDLKERHARKHRSGPRLRR